MRRNPDVYGVRSEFSLFGRDLQERCYKRSRETLGNKTKQRGIS